MSTLFLVAKERQPGFPFGLGQKQAKKQKSQKIRCKCATVARYSMLYRFLCNALQRASQKAKKYGANAPQLHAIRCSIEYCVMLCNGMLRDLQYSLVKMSTSEISRIEALQPARQNMVSCIVGCAQAENSTRERLMADNQHL